MNLVTAAVQGPLSPVLLIGGGGELQSAAGAVAVGALIILGVEAAGSDSEDATEQAITLFGMLWISVGAGLAASKVVGPILSVIGAIGIGIVASLAIGGIGNLVFGDGEQPEGQAADGDTESRFASTDGSGNLEAGESERGGATGECQSDRADTDQQTVVSLDESLPGSERSTPPGFAVTTDAYEQYIEEQGLAETLSTFEDVDPEDSVDLRAAAQSAQELITESELPTALRQDILQAYDKRTTGDGNNRYLVRSAPQGCNDAAEPVAPQRTVTFMNNTREDIVQNIKEIWATLFEAGPLRYRVRNGYDHRDVGMEVVLHEQLPDAFISGTIRQLTHDDVQKFLDDSSEREDQNHSEEWFSDYVKVETAFGIAVDAERVQTDEYTLRIGDIMSSDIREQEFAAWPDDSGLVFWKEVPANQQPKRNLTDSGLWAVHDLMSEVQSDVGHPHKLTWIMNGENQELLLVGAVPVPLEDDTEERVTMQENTGTQSAVEESAEAAADSDTGAEQSDEKPAAEATAHSTTDPSEDESELPSSVSLPEKTLDHVAGMSELESTIRERIIDPVVDERYERYGAETPTGVLLHGPPGSGKTHLAESITGEIDYRLIEITASNLLSSDFGGSEQNISKLFDLASQAAPAVVFIDEFDALAADRDGESHSATQRIVNELLSQLSNLNESDDDVIVIAATNRLDSIDPAIKRSGRFDETIEVTLPNAETRSAILQSELEDGPPVELTREEVQEIVDRTDGFSSSDMVELADRTIRRTIRDTDPDDTPVVTVSDLSEVVPEIEDKKQQDTGAAQLLEEAPDRDLDDVAGMASLKSELREKVLSPLQTPEQFEEYGLDVTNGVLLYGPPGTGKTYTTRALAGELGFDFVSVTASDVTSKYIGEGAQNIREVFEVALGNQPCIVFVDEIDAIGGSRAGSGQMSNSEQQMVTELLTGLNEVQDEEVVVVAATNQRDRLDPALTRSGRFDAEIEVPPPTAETRTAILEHHLEGRPVAEEEIDWQRLAEMTRTDVDGNPFVASDLKLIADTAARYAMTRNRSSSDETGTGEIQQEDIERAVENTTSSLA